MGLKGCSLSASLSLDAFENWHIKVSMADTDLRMTYADNGLSMSVTF